MVVQRKWAAKNPRATFKTPITVEDVLNSRMIAYPFRLSQCRLVTDGGGALIMVAAERARDFPQKLAPGRNRRPVYLLGTGESVETPMVVSPVIPAKAGNPEPQGLQWLPWTPAFAGATKEDLLACLPRRRPKAFAEARITHSDVDHLMIYDAPCSLAGQALRICRSMASRVSALCRAGRAGVFIAERNTAPGVPGTVRQGRPPGDPAQPQWRRSLLHAFRRCARPKSPAPRSRSAAASAACSPLCRTRRLER
jgi:hypothetical protein